MFRAIFRVAFSRVVFFVLSFATAIGIPFLTLDSTWRDSAWTKIQGVTSTFSRPPSATTAFDGALVTPPLEDSSRTEPVPTLVGPQIQGLHEVFDWAITPQMVTSRWKRVSTAYDDPRLDGMRVPVSTGYQTSDFAGSLTYYFDHQGQLQRITFEGKVGNPQPLVDYITRRFNLERLQMSGLDIYISRWHGQPTSMLRMQRAHVVDYSASHGSRQVDLELNHYNLEYGLSRRAYSQLTEDGVIRQRRQPNS